MKDIKHHITSASPSSIFTYYATNAFLIISFIYISLNVYFDYRAGGNNWKQGDWLINNEAGNLRRGSFGSIILSASDIFVSSPLLIVSLIQIMFLAILFISFRLLADQGQKSPLTILILISPAIFTVFWVADPQGSVRKELLAFAGLSLSALAAVREIRLIFWLGVLTFCVSILAHEAMALFTPTFFGIILVSRMHKTAFSHALSASLIVSLISLFTFFYTIIYSQASDVMAICAPLVERGLHKEICGGAIKWTTYDIAYGFQQVTSRVNIWSFGGFLISYVAALAPFLYFIWIGQRSIANIVVLVLLALPFLPLYFIAVDWGRWMSFHIFSAAILLASAMAKDNFPIRRNPSNHHIFLLLIFAFLISPQHTIGIIWGGAVRRAATEFWWLLS
jgi:hypothetical protein